MAEKGIEDGVGLAQHPIQEVHGVDRLMVASFGALPRVEDRLL